MWTKSHSLTSEIKTRNKSAMAVVEASHGRLRYDKVNIITLPCVHDCSIDTKHTLRRENTSRTNSHAFSRVVDKTSKFIAQVGQQSTAQQPKSCNSKRQECKQPSSSIKQGKQLIQSINTRANRSPAQQSKAGLSALHGKDK